MKLVPVGGVQGVGKSTIFNWLKSKFGGQVTFLDPGEIFRQNRDSGANRPAEDVEELIVSNILELPDEAVVVAHWHYAVVRPNGYIPQISFDRLNRLARSGKVSEVLMVSVEASTDIIRSRRLKDPSGKKRNLVREMIDEERRLDLEFLGRHYEIFSVVLGEDKVKTHVFSNFGPKVEDLELSDLAKLIVE